MTYNVFGGKLNIAQLNATQTWSGLPVLLKICAGLTSRTQLNGRSVYAGRPRDCQDRAEYRAVAEWKINPGSSKGPREIEALTGISQFCLTYRQCDLWLQVLRRKKAHLLSDSDHDKCSVERYCVVFAQKVCFTIRNVYTQDTVNCSLQYYAAVSCHGLKHAELMFCHCEKCYSGALVIS